MQLWDHIYVDFDDRSGIYTAHGAGQGVANPRLDELLRDIGGNGYELIAVTNPAGSPQPVLYFKRPRSELGGSFAYGGQPALREAGSDADPSE